MIKNDDLEEFLFFFNKAENIPFSHWEDALINNFDALDVPFIDYSKSIIGWCDFLKIEISENLLSLTADDKQLYLEHLKRKLKLETGDYDKKNLFDLLKYYDINGEILDFNKNKSLKELLHKSFKSVSGFENLNKLSNLHREYYLYLLFIERDKILKYIDDLVEGFSFKSESSDDAYKNTTWFKVGLCFASGQAQKLYHIYKFEKGHFKKITLELGFKETDRPYFSETINNMTNDPKNIYRNFDKMKKIHDYCKKNEISICKDFDNIYNALQTK